MGIPSNCNDRCFECMIALWLIQEMDFPAMKQEREKLAGGDQEQRRVFGHHLFDVCGKNQFRNVLINLNHSGRFKTILRLTS